MLSPAKFKMLYNQQHAAVRKVYDAVPMSEAWDHSQIIGELRRVGHSMRDMSVVLGCLDTLRRQGLVNEPQKGFFSRVQIRVVHDYPLTASTSGSLSAQRCNSAVLTTSLRLESRIS